MRTIVGVVLAIFLCACAESHLRTSASSAGDSGSIAIDAGTTHDAGAAADAGASMGVPCGPNRCLSGEICCDAACGVCAFADECVVFGCGEP